MNENPRKKHIWKFAAVGLVLGVLWAALTYDSGVRASVESGFVYVIRLVGQCTVIGWLLGWLWARIWGPRASNGGAEHR